MEPAAPAPPQPGEPLPEFRLPTAGGGEIGVSDYRGRKNLLLWFSKGLFCPYCRRNMARLSQAYAQFQASGAEILQITINTVDEANLYFRSYRLATPYLCDPDARVHLRYGMSPERQTVGAVAENWVTSIAMNGKDLLMHGQKAPGPGPAVRMGMNQWSQLIVVADRAGVVRDAQRIGPFDTLPTVAELLVRLEPLRAESPSTA